MGLSGLVLLVTLAAPLFVLFSPVLVPAALMAGLVVAGFLVAGALAVGGLSSLAWIVGYVLRGGVQGGAGGVAGMVVQPLDNGKRHGAEGSAFVRHRLRDAADAVHNKGQEVAST